MPGVMAITMAGFGSRFRDAGYTQPKYMIEALGLPLFDWSMASLAAFQDAGWRFSFAVRRADRAVEFIRRRCDGLGTQVEHFLELDEPTDGQATTALLLAEASAPGLPFAIFNIDTFVAPGAMGPALVPDGCDGWVPCFPGPGDGWSFARLGEDGRVAEMREKIRVSPHATTGLYWFRTARLYADSYARYYGQGGREERGERYVAPLYNQLIADGCDVRIADLALDDIGMLGTPSQVEAFMRSPPDAARRVAMASSSVPRAAGELA